MFACRRLFCATEGCIFARASRVAIVCRSEWNTMPFFETRRIQSALPVTRAAPVRIVANEFDVAAARLPALPGRAGFDYPVTACLQDLPFTSVPSFARSLAEEGDMFWSSIGSLRLAAAT